MRATPLLLATLLAAASAHADPTAADRETARTLMQQAREARDRGDLKEALKRFKGADDIMHVPTTGLEVARTQVSLGMLVEARDTIAAIRQIPTKANDPAPFKDARDKAEDLDSSLNGRVPSLEITFKGAPDGEKPSVTVDGVPVPAGAVGLPRAVDPGHHVVVAKTATAEGQAEVDVKEGEQKPVEVTLVAGAAPPAPPPTSPGAETPLAPVTSHSPTWLTWAGIGLAGAGAIAGGVTGYLSMSKKSSLDGECPGGVCSTQAARSDYESASSMATISTIGFAAAGVGGVVAIVSLLVGHEESAAPASAPPDSASPPASDAPAPAARGPVVTPWVGLGSAGLTGTF